MKSINYLSKFKKNITSQCGEDGIIEEVFRLLNITSGSVLDIGASDGVWHSNTFSLLKRGFSVYAIEASDNAKKMFELKTKFQNLYPIQAKLTINKDDPTHINNILNTLGVPEELEFMSIDIDSIDPWVLKDIDRKPKFFVAEIEPRKYPTDNVWHDATGNRKTNPPQNLTGFGPMYSIAKSKGYHFIGQSAQNIFFLRNDLLSTLNCLEITSVHELSNFDPAYLSKEDKKRWEKEELPIEFKCESPDERKVKLHLGCGTKHLDGYVNIDIRYLPGVDEVNNIKFLRNYQNNSIDEIYACHVLEHFGRWEYKDVLRRWYELLKSEGTLRIAVPNFEAVCKHYMKHKNLKTLMGFLYGGQDYDENFHYVTFDFNTIKQELHELGFSNITLWDAEKYAVDDYSKSYLPHMDKRGMLMSLNIVATK